METISKKYIVDEHDKKIAVQIPIETFEKIEEVLENYALVKLIKENEGDEILNLNEAKAYYDQLQSPFWFITAQNHKICQCASVCVCG
jgi:hypothetical protein